MSPAALYRYFDNRDELPGSRRRQPAPALPGRAAEPARPAAGGAAAL